MKYVVRYSSNCSYGERTLATRSAAGVASARTIHHLLYVEETDFVNSPRVVTLVTCPTSKFVYLATFAALDAISLRLCVRALVRQSFRHSVTFATFKDDFLSFITSLLTDGTFVRMNRQ